MPAPVEIDVAVGIRGERVHFHIECMAHVDPAEFVESVQAHVRELLREARATVEAQRLAVPNGAKPTARKRAAA